jgi:hypothetical protein
MVLGIRKIGLTCIALVATALIAWGDSVEPVDIFVPEALAAGSTVPCALVIEGTGVAHIQSIPSGVVDINMSVVDGVNNIDLPVAYGYSGPVIIYATMTGSSQAVSTTSTVE